MDRFIPFDQAMEDDKAAVFDFRWVDVQLLYWHPEMKHWTKMNPTYSQTCQFYGCDVQTRDLRIAAERAVFTCPQHSQFATPAMLKQSNNIDLVLKLRKLEYLAKAIESEPT